MKEEYKGYEIVLEQDKSMGGWGMIYYSIFLNGEEMRSDFTEEQTTLEEFKEVVFWWIDEGEI